MSILAFGGEMGFFIPSDSGVIEDALDSAHDSAFARGSTGSFTQLSYGETVHVGAQTDFWFGGDYKHRIGSPGDYLNFINSAGTAVVRLYMSGSLTTFTLQPQYLLSSVWTNLGTAITINQSTRQTYDIHVDVTNGTFDLYLAGTNRISASVTLSGISDIAYVRCGSCAESRWSQVVMATESTIGFRVGTIVMTGQGTTHTFATGGFANIDELAYSDADFINSDTAAQVELFTGTPVPTFTGYKIRALAVTARAKKGGSGPTQIQLALRSAGTTYFSASKSLDVAYGAFCNVWETNPATSAAFLSTEISALEYGVKSIA